MIVLCIVDLYMPILNRVSSWMARCGTIEKFEVLMVVAMRGGSLGCEFCNRVDYEAMCGSLSRLCRVVL